jgi:hypothetical protein
MNTVWVVLLPLAAKGPNPADVKPGWLGFAVFLALAAATALLLWSFTRQLRKVDFEEEAPPPSDRPRPSSSGPGARPKRS